MARPSKYNWEDIKKHYEAGMTQAEIVNKFGCDKGSLSKKVKSEAWTLNQLADAYISEAVEVKQLQNQLNQQDERVCEIADAIIVEKSKHIDFFHNSALKNQVKANSLLDKMNKIHEIEAHSRTTQRNKETVLGKDKTVELNNTNAQQNNETKVIQVEYK